VSWYAKHVVPRLIDWAMDRADVAKQRSKVIPRAEGVTLEIGMGSGLNLPFYGDRVTKLYGVDPSAELHAMARRRAAEVSRPVELFLQSAEERLPLQDGSVDTVVCSWSLCSIPDAGRALREARRVVRRGGSLLFVEHGRAPEGSVRVWQDRLDPLWTRIAGGCHMNRPTDEVIRGAGFELAELEREFLPGPKVLTYTYRGRAVAA